MQEKVEIKKRFRPTLGMYRALEKELSESKERERMLSEHLALVRGKLEIADLCNETLQRDLNGYKSSVKHMEGELFKIREEVDSYHHELEARDAEVERLKRRGFFARLLNLCL